MSDDTPTQRFDAPRAGGGGVSPTAPLGTPAPQQDPEKKRSRGLLIALIAIGAALVIAIIVLVIVLLGGTATPTALVTATDSATPSVSSAPSATATETPVVTPSATSSSSSSGGNGSSGGTASGPKINSFTANPAAPACPAADATVKNPTYISFRWSTSDVDSVEFGLIDESGNYQLQATNLPPQGTSDSDLPGSGGTGWAYPCGTDKVTYVLKATGSGKTVTAKVLVDDRTYN